jgi:signal transduction histidine kinase/CheY-like chemotaxis protein
MSISKDKTLQLQTVDFDKIKELINQKQFADALSVATQLYQQFSSNKLDLNYAILNELIGDVYAALQDYHLALEHYHKALSYYRDNNENDLLLEQLAKLGGLQLVNYQFKKAIDLFHDGLKIAIRIGKLDKIVEFEFMLGNAYNWDDNLEESARYLLSSIHKSDKINNPTFQVKNNASYAILLRKMHKYDASEEYFKISLALSEKNNNLHLHEIRRSYGVLQFYKGNLDKAEKLLSEAIEHLSLDSSLAVIYDYLAQLYEKKQNYESAYYYYKQFHLLKIKLLERGYTDDNNIAQAKVGLENAKRERLIAEETNNAKSLFIATISHEIRTPMNIIIGTTSLMQNDHPKPEHVKYLTTLKRSGENLLGIINDILDVSKIEAGKLEIEYEPVLLNEIFENIVTTLEQPAAEKNLKLSYSIDKKIDYAILSDPLRLNQIITNLVSNSIKFTAKGKISCNVKLKKNNTLQITVSDTGIGIPKDKLPNIFDQYEQVRTKSQKKYKGTGLGLSISKKLVELMNGNISIKSKVNVGTTFIIDLPFEKAETQKHLTQSIVNKDTAFLNNKTILIVDDFEDNRFIVRETLHFFSKQINILEAVDGVHALEILKQNKIDIVIMDLDMPKMNGFEALSEIRKNKKTKHLKVVASTASLIANGDDEFIEFGFDAYLPKPFDINQFFTLLEKMLQ